MKKKLISFALALIMALCLMPTSAFAAANTPISSIDLTGLNLGADWAGKPVSAVKADISGYSGFASQNISFVMGAFADSNLQFLADTDSFVAGNTYMIQLVWKANDGYYFDNNKASGAPANYLGTVDPVPVTSFLGSNMTKMTIDCPGDATAEQMIYMVLVYRIEVKGHVHEKGTHHDAVSPTCEAGGTVEYWDCTGCDKKLNAECEEIDDIANGDPLGHSFDTDNWETSETEHWHAATCEHTEEKDSLGTHEDSDKDHKCDVCGYAMSDCIDENKDHKCDYAGCGKTLSECKDEDQNHVCDVCGRDLNSPQTGDNSNMLLWVVLLAASGTVLTKNTIYSRKKKKTN